MFIDKQLGQNRKWINIDSDRITENSYLYKKYDIDKETIEYALDKNERAHMDYNRENGTITFIYNVLNLEKDKEYYETIPMAFIVQDTRLVTISNQENVYIIEQMMSYLEAHGELSIFKLLLDKHKDDLNRLLRKTTTSKNLYALSDLETGMVYLLAAAKQNRMLLEHIKAHAIYRRMDDIEKEQFDDAMIEANQLVSMTELISNVLQQLSGSYNNILNNNLNDNLTTLTIFEALLAVLAVITGFFGMNIPLPLTQDPNAWIYVSVCSFILWLLLAKVMRWIVKKR